MIIREGQPNDAEGIALANIASWQAAYKGIISTEGLATLSVQKTCSNIRKALQSSTSLFLVAEEEGSIIGYVEFMAARDQDKDPKETAEIYALYLHPHYWGLSVGKQLILKSIDSLRDYHFHEVVLWVLEQNIRGRTFYEKAGFMPDGHRKSDCIRGSDVVEVRYGRGI